MPAAFPFFLFIMPVIILLLIVMIGQGLKDQKRWHHAIEQVGKRFQARIEQPSRWVDPVLVVPIDRFHAKVDFPEFNDVDHSRFSIPWPGSKLRCEVRTPQPFDGMRRWFGTKRIATGDPGLDHEFFISGSDTAAVAMLLTPAVRQAVLNLAKYPEWYRFQHLVVKWENDALTISRPITVRTYRSLERFVLDCSELFVVSVNATSNEHEAICGLKEPDESESVCDVCGEALGADLHYCSICGTPFHRACRKQFGRCPACMP